MDEKAPKYKKIVDYLKHKIENGEYQPDVRLPIEYELAEMFGVSRITSRRALDELKREGLIYRKKGGGSYVNIKKVSNEEDKLKNEDHKIDNHVDKSNGTDIIALVLPAEASTGKLGEYIKGASEYLNSEGFYLTVCDTHMNLEKEKDVLIDLVSKGVKGIIFYPYSDRHNLQVLYDLCIKNYPIVTIDKYFDSVPISYVVSDNFDGGYQAASHLMQLGHKTISYVSGSSIEHATSTRNRYFGYCRALADAGIHVNPDILLLGYHNQWKEWVTAREKDINTDELPFEKAYEYHIQFANEFISSFLDKGITAIQTDEDSIGIWFIKACIRMGIRIPEDISITGFDNSDFSKYSEVPLTTVEQDSISIGKVAAELVVKSIKKENSEYNKIIQPIKLIKRQSSGVASKTRGSENSGC